MSEFLAAVLATAAGKAAAAATVGLVVAGGAAAATGNLPDINDLRGTAEVEIAEVEEIETLETEDDGERPEDTHGFTVSEFAKNTELEGCERGQAVAAVARGEDPDDAKECLTGQERAEQARDNRGGNGAGASEKGQERAAEARENRGGNGVGAADEGRSNKPDDVGPTGGDDLDEDNDDIDEDEDDDDLDEDDDGEDE